MEATQRPNVEYGDPDIALPNEILRSVVGSGVHGISIAGTDDHDEMGVYIEPPEWVLGVERHREDYIWRTQRREFAAATVTPTWSCTRCGSTCASRSRATRPSCCRSSLPKSPWWS